MPDTPTPSRSGDPRVLGQLLLIQSTLHVLPTPEAMGDFLCHALPEVPGVAGCCLCVDDLVVGNSIGAGVCGAQDCASAQPGGAAQVPGRMCQVEARPDLVILMLDTVHRTYGRLVLALSDPDQFQPYYGHLRNLTNFVALTTENRVQQALLQTLNDDLEAEVRVRRAAEASLQEAQRSLEQDLLQAQKLESIGRLAGGVAHDFNNLLTAILGYTEMAGDLHPSADVSQCLREVRIAGNRAADLTRQLLAFARRQTISAQIIDLNTAIRETASLLHRLIGEHVTLKMDLCPELWTVNADPGQVSQLLTNLAVNARDAMPEGGCLTLQTKNRPFDASGDDPAGFEAAGDHVVLTVADTGTGISPDIQERIFEPFFTTKERGRGTGLGLASCYGIVKQSGGQITVQSEPGVGTRFVVALPRARGPLSPATAALRTHTGRSGTETILVAEDDDAIRGFVTQVLRQHGYRVLEAADGQQARELGLARQEGIDLLITDVVMPRVNGRLLARALTAARPAMKVLFMSGYPDEVVQQEGGPGTGTHLLQKPFTPTQLLEQVRATLDRGI